MYHKKGVNDMMNILKKGFILIGLYSIFTIYLFLASDRIERLENKEEREFVNVSINYSE